MRSRRVGNLADFVGVRSAAWRAIDAQAVTLLPAPLGMQPKPYISVSWRGRRYGEVDRLAVKCVHDGKRIAFCLQWAAKAQTDASGENFPDGAAIALPVRGEPVLLLMGAPDAPIHMLQWQAGIAEPRSVLTTGIGTSRSGPAIGMSASAHWENGRWTIVVARDLSGEGDVAPLSPGRQTRVGFAVWNGSNGERAGIKAVAGDWTTLNLDP